MESEVHRQLFEFLDEIKLISKHQFGFQKKKSTELAAIALLDQVRFAVDKEVLYIRRNNIKVNSIKTGRIVIADLLP